MWRHRFETTTDVPALAIWPVIADVARWAEVDRNIARIEIEGEPRVGTRFKLKPKGGPTLSFDIAAFDPPHTYADRCRMPGAVMTTWHRLEAGAPTRIVVEIEIEGPLSRLWGWMVGRKHAAGLPAQTERIIARARELMDRNATAA